jgi:hypothetical protein
MRPELETLMPASRSAVLIALEALTVFPVWRRIREHQELSVEQAGAVWVESVDRLLPPTPALTWKRFLTPRQLTHRAALADRGT